MLKIYADLTSQPARACVALCTIETERVRDWEHVRVRLSKAEHRTPEYKKMNPNGKVPAMRVVTAGKPDFHLFESHAMMKYICQAKQLPDHWYPTSSSKDIEMLARMDMYLDWHHANIRMGAAGYIWSKYFQKNMTGIEAPPERISESLRILFRSLQQIERIWLTPSRGTKFMFGDQPSIADLSLACEITQLEGISYEPELRKNFP